MGGSNTGGGNTGGGNTGGGAGGGTTTTVQGTLGSYQIDLTQSLDCDVAVLLNITPDHLDRYAGFDAYAASKARLFEMQKHGWAVVGNEDLPSRTIADRLGQRLVRLSDREYSRLRRDWPSLRGPHNRQNAAAAIAVAKQLGVEQSTIEAALKSFTGLPHRMERVR